MKFRPFCSVMTVSAARTSEFGSTDPLSGLEHSVLLTVLYADLFDFALNESELKDRLVLRNADTESIRQAVQALEGRFLSVSDGYVTWRDREELVPLRRRRAVASKELWKTAHRYASWLSRIPFVRMVAVSGSLAVENAGDESDIDLFCITETERLWLARLFIVPLSKMTRLLPRYFPRYLCPNYLLTLGTLEIRHRNLFTAHEVAQARPLFGFAAYADFRRANAWIGRFLPQGSMRRADDAEPPRPRLTRLAERVFAGRIGDRLDSMAHRVFRSFYRRRAQRQGWPWRRLEEAYQRGRYTVPEGGYVPVIQDLFIDRLHERLAGALDESELRRLFPTSAQKGACYDWERLFHLDYGTSVPPTPAV